MAGHEYLNEQRDLEGAIEYLPIQEWFMKKEIKNRNHFNHSFLIRVIEKIDKQRLGRALEKLNKRHDMLRAQYREGKQRYRKESRIAEIREWDIKGKTAEATHKELTGWQDRFDIEQGYLWQSGIIRGYEDGSERIYFAARSGELSESREPCAAVRSLQAKRRGHCDLVSLLIFSIVIIVMVLVIWI